MQPRRIQFRVLPALIACSFALLASLQAGWAASSLKPRDQGMARHIILFIGDGMHLEHEIAASRYLYGRDTRLSFHGLPYQNNVTTWDVTTYNDYAGRARRPAYSAAAIQPEIGYDPALGGAQPHPLQREGIREDYFLSPRSATDSASAATALSTGHKTEKGRIAWGPSGIQDTRLTTIAEILRDKRGASIGLVTTVPFSHATPAALVSHSPARKDFAAISREILFEFRPEVVIGGGHPKWCTKYLAWGLYTEIMAGGLKDYVTVERVAGEDGSARLMEGAHRAAREGRKLFGLFGGAEGSFEPPLPIDRPGAPSVTQTTRENPLLGEAAIAALKVLSRGPEGFFLMVEQGDIDWANHNNDFKTMIGCVWDLHTAVQSVMDFVDRPGDQITWSNTLLIVTSDHANSYMRLDDRKRLGRGTLPAQVGRAYPNGEVSYGTTGHTNELVRVYARGAGIGTFKPHEGRWYPKTRLLDNTHLFHVMMEAGGLPQPSPLKLAPWRGKK